MFGPEGFEDENKVVRLTPQEDLSEEEVKIKAAEDAEKEAIEAEEPAALDPDEDLRFPEAA